MARMAVAGVAVPPAVPRVELNAQRARCSGGRAACAVQHAQGAVADDHAEARGTILEVRGRPTYRPTLRQLTGESTPTRPDVERHLCCAAGQRHWQGHSRVGQAGERERGW